MSSTVIAGLGVSGLACALELTRCNAGFAAFERDGRPGGLARSELADGFRFDHGPHIILGVTATLERMFSELPKLELSQCSGPSCVAIRNDLRALVPAPFQQNLNWLPWPERLRVLLDLTVPRRKTPPRNYREYATASCGRRIYDLFLGPYEAKRLRFDPGEISSASSRRIEMASLRSVLTPRWLNGVRKTDFREYRFLYPRSGGMEALPRAMAAMLPDRSLHYGTEVKEIDLRAKRLQMSSGATVDYEHLVLSLSLPAIVGLIKDAPAALTQAANDLVYASIHVVNFGIEGAVPPWAFMRFPRNEVGFYRVSFPSSYASDSSPEGASIAVAEVSHHQSRYPVSPREARDVCLRGLTHLGLIGKNQKILVETVHGIRYGHVIYNSRTEKSVRFVLDHLNSHSVFTCGKYGLWKDMLMTDSMSTGIEAAHAVMARHMAEIPAEAVD